MQAGNEAAAHDLKRRRSDKRLIWLPLTALIALLAFGTYSNEQVMVNLQLRNQAPGLTHIFGTDWLGRDLFFRTMSGLTRSLTIGLIAALLSTLLAVIFGILSWWHTTIDMVIVWLADLLLSLPHLVMLLLLSFAMGGGMKGLIIGLTLTHWPKLYRLLRSEILQINESPFIHVSRQLGKTKSWIAGNHLLILLLPQIVVGFVLMFPHAILHEAAITFLGFGLPPEQPAIGSILSEAMGFLTAGIWWMALFPGLILLATVLSVDWYGRLLGKKLQVKGGHHHGG